MPDFAGPMLENIMGFLMLGAILAAIWVGLSKKSLWAGAMVFVVGVVVIGVLGGFVEDPETGFEGAWEFIQSDILGL